MKLPKAFAMQRGEIATFLTIISLVIIGAGMALGTALVRQTQSPSTSAQMLPGPYPFRSEVQLTDKFGDLVKWEEGITYENTITNVGFPTTTANGSLKDPTCTRNCDAQVLWNTGEVPANLQGAVIEQTIKLPSGYKILTEPYCIGDPEDMCEIEIDTDNATYAKFSGLKIQSGGDITYGMVVERNAPLCLYSTTTAVYKETKGQYFSLPEIGGSPFVATNDRGNEFPINSFVAGAQISRAKYETDTFPHDPSGVANYKLGSPATVTLGDIPAGWTIKEVFCDPKSGSVRGCPTASEISQMNAAIASGTGDGKIIDGFRVNCGVNLEYGWILEKVKAPTPVPPTSIPPTVEPDAKGNMEVRVVALNYPNVTEHWNKNHIASKKPASCSRQGASEQKRPLYLSSFTVRAECVGGGCVVGSRPDDIKVGKRTGFANFTNIPAGNYKLSIKGVSDRGFSMWDGCDSASFTVSKGATNQDAVIILENEEDGTYTTETSESKCKENGGQPNLIEGIGGNLCYNPGGTGGGDPDPTQSPDCPDGKINKQGQCDPACCANDSQCPSGQSCAISNGNCNSGLSCKENTPPTPPDNTVRVSVRNDVQDVKKLSVKIEPCPPSGPCSQTVTYNGTGTKPVSFDVTDSRSYEVLIREISLQSSILNFVKDAFAAENARVVVDRTSGIDVPDGSEDRKVVLTSPGFVDFRLIPKGAVPPPPPVPSPVPPPSGVPYTIELRNTSIRPVSNFKEVIRNKWTHTQDYADKIHDAAIDQNWNPALLLTVWMEETGASHFTILEAGGGGQGRATEHLGCRP